MAIRSFFFLYIDWLVFVLIFPQHLHISSQGEQGDNVLGFPDLFSNEFRPKAKREFENFYSKSFGNEEMTQFMGKNQYAQNHHKRENIVGQNMYRLI